MDFSFTDEQQMLRDSVSRYLSKDYDFETRQGLVRSDAPWSTDVWSQFAEFGLFALPFAEDVGGLGGSITDVVAIAEIFGEHLIVEPYVTSILLAGRALAHGEIDDAKEALTKLMTGEAVSAFAYEEGKGTAAPSDIALTAKQNAQGFTLAGDKRVVIAGAQADQLLVAARLADTDTIILVMVDTAGQGIETTPFQTIDGRAAAHIRFNDVQASSFNLLSDDAADAIQTLIAEAIIALCAEAVGAMGALLRVTSEYAATRKQFGQSIGAFQAVAHRLADIKIAYTKARSTLLYTTALAEAGKATSRDISILKAQTGKLGRAIGEAAIQTHGGVGMTDELNVGHYHKRILMIDALFGDSEYHLRMIGRAG